ncbi:hypothetical protein RN2511_035830 [Rhodococcus sp. NKCM2511]|uniref:hypothetical protein n=1 Tax=Rhodococcus sp. NKCM2511 TaxID=2766011 RepID=UPI00190FE78F|nr:hypothetical protein [Rhodococcus sp. NKCM2511]GHP18847.1 hypothetical protein RN2511_035830 [Rhodococcus sp. NKCM2511]
MSYFGDAQKAIADLDLGDLSVDQKIELSKSRALLAVAAELSILRERFPERTER